MTSTGKFFIKLLNLML